MRSGCWQCRAPAPQLPSARECTSTMRWRAGSSMPTASPRAHWDNVYATKRDNEVSWFQEKASLSLDLIRSAGAGRGSALIDIGGGASRLVDALLDEGCTDISVLDVA